MAERIQRPAWWEGDFDNTGKTQLGWALEAAAAYRAAHPEQYGGVTPSCDTPVVTPSVTPSAARKRAWREANKERSKAINKAAKRRAVLA